MFPDQMLYKVTKPGFSLLNVYFVLYYVYTP